MIGKYIEKKVWNETKVTLIKYSNKIKNLDLRGRKYGYALDHKFSVSDGFKNNVEPSIIAHYENLQIISISENSKKQHNSNISLEELFTGMENK